MSFVPIIYTSLILFAILMFIVVSISYIAYKIRNRNSNSVQNRRTDNSIHLSHNRIVNNRVSYPPQPIRVVSAIKKPELRKPEVVPVQPRTTIVTSISSSYNNGSREREDNWNNDSHRMTDYNQRTHSGSFKSRLEILNKISPEESNKEKFSVSGSGSIALPKYYENFKAIHYYSDDDDEHLYKPSRYYH